MERYNREMADLLNQRLHWPILAFAVAKAGESESDSERGIGTLKGHPSAGGEVLAKLKASEDLCAQHSCRITELEAELVRERALIDALTPATGEGEAVAVVGISAAEIVKIVRTNIHDALSKGLELEDALTAIEKDLVAREIAEANAKYSDEMIEQGFAGFVGNRVREKVEEALIAGQTTEEAIESVFGELEAIRKKVEVEKPQGGEEASRRAHNSEHAGSSPAPGTPATESPSDTRPPAESESAEGRGESEGGAGGTLDGHLGQASLPSDTGAGATGDSPSMTVAEAAATLGNGEPEAADSEAGKVLAEAKAGPAKAKKKKKGAKA